MVTPIYAWTAVPLLLLLLPFSLHAQPSAARAAWSSLSAKLMTTAAALPEASYEFRPAPEARSFAQLIGHLADAHFLFCAPLLPPTPPRSGAAKLTGKPELVAALRDSINFCTAAADRVADSDPPVQLFGREQSRLAVLWANIAHSSEHYGNAVTYLRLQGIVPPASAPGSAARVKVYYDQAHGELGPHADIAGIAARVGFHVSVSEQSITPASLQKARLLYLRAPSKEFSRAEKDAIVAFVKAGGSLLLVVDEEQRQPLAATGVNDLIQPFGIRLTPDTPYVHNCGAIAKAGEINRADRELPYSGGRAVEGGTPFAFQLDQEGKPAQAFAASAKVEGGGRLVVMGEGMASIFLGQKQGVRLSGPPRDARNTVYWGQDSAIFMEEVLAWLVQR
ncbi:MAG: DinB family protein [Bryobacterales bacterium]|nr:DinB family protein [Bryobacterales bacterium]